MIIESVDNKKIKEYRKLKEKKYRESEKLFLVEGEHLVLEAYKSDLLKEIILCERDIDLEVEKVYVTEKVMNTISELPSKVDIIGVCEIKFNELDLNSPVMILDGVQDPGNLGAIIRSAVAFNIKNIVLSKNTVDLYNTKALRSAQGMNFHLNIVRDDLVKVINLLKENNYTVYGTDVVDGIDVKNVENDRKYAIIMGNEGNGISEEVKKLVDKNIYIKMNENCESLNVSVSASIIMYELNK
ncbi:MAG: RNA methyltransferase [Bacilli bacterium]|nr:RNA methyltransferase [Bacilli bacterium]